MPGARARRGSGAPRDGTRRCRHGSDDLRPGPAAQGGPQEVFPGEVYLVVPQAALVAQIQPHIRGAQSSFMRNVQMTTSSVNAIREPAAPLKGHATRSKVLVVSEVSTSAHVTFAELPTSRRNPNMPDHSWNTAALAQHIYIEAAARRGSLSHFSDSSHVPGASCGPLPGARILFIDGDNTVRRRPNGTGPEGVDALEAALTDPDLEGVLIVASGQWKDVLSLHDIRTIFCDQVATRIVDKAPSMNVADDTQYKAHVEIHAWLAAHPEIADYCVLEPFWPYEPHVESAVFIPDGMVFGEAGYEVDALKRAIGNGTST